MVNHLCRSYSVYLKPIIQIKLYVIPGEYESNEINNEAIDSIMRYRRI